MIVWEASRFSAIENATILANNDSSAAVSGGAAAFGPGTSLAVNGTIATNAVQSNALATVLNSTIAPRTTNPIPVGDVSVNAQNTSTISATTNQSTTSGAQAGNAILAFNTIGYADGNILFKTVDALVGTDIGTSNPAGVEASIINSTVTSTGEAVVVTRVSTEHHHRDILGNSVTSVAAGLVEATARSRAWALCSTIATLVNSYAHAFTQWRSDPGRGSVDQRQRQRSINAHSHIQASAQSTNDLGKGLVNNLANAMLLDYQYTTSSGSQVLHYGDKVRVADGYAGGGTAGTVYRGYVDRMARRLHLGTADFTNWYGTLEAALDHQRHPRWRGEFGDDRGRPRHRQRVCSPQDWSRATTSSATSTPRYSTARMSPPRRATSRSLRLSPQPSRRSTTARWHPAPAVAAASSSRTPF